MSKLQILLNAKHCSGRGVQFKLLSPVETSKVQQGAARILGAEATIIELKRTEWLLGAKSMITGVTVQKDLKSLQGVKDLKWRTLSSLELDTEFESLFTAKDSQVLEALYREYHEVNPEELESIVGKALPVSEA